MFSRFAFFTFAGLLTSAAPIWAEGVRGSISVTGAAELAVIPDLATIQIGVVNVDETAQSAVEGMSADLRQILERIEAFDLPPADIQTSALNLSADFDYSERSERPKIIGYTARSTLSLRVRELDDLSTLLDEVLKGGAHQLNGLAFDVADRAPLIAMAQEQAIANAMDKAERFADASGVTLGALISLSEPGIAAPQGVRAFSARMEDAAVPIMTGDISISARVSMTYAIENED